MAEPRATVGSGTEEVIASCEAMGITVRVIQEEEEECQSQDEGQDWDDTSAQGADSANATEGCDSGDEASHEVSPRPSATTSVITPPTSNTAQGNRPSSSADGVAQVGQGVTPTPTAYGRTSQQQPTYINIRTSKRRATGISQRRVHSSGYGMESYPMTTIEEEEPKEPLTMRARRHTSKYLTTTPASTLEDSMAQVCPRCDSLSPSFFVVLHTPTVRTSTCVCTHTHTHTHTSLLCVSRHH